jgi:hypothetical protein
MILLSGTEYEHADAAEAKRLAEEGRVFSFPASDLYAEWYGFPEKPDLESIFLYGYSRKDRDFVERIMEDIGMTGYEEGEEGYLGPEPLDGIPSHQILQYDVQTGKTGNGQWVAQAAYRYSADGFGLVKMYFDHEPSREQEVAAYLIREFDKRPNDRSLLRNLEKASGIHPEEEEETEHDR